MSGKGGKRSGEYFFRREHLTKRNDPIERKPSDGEGTVLVDENWVERMMERPSDPAERIVADIRQEQLREQLDSIVRCSAAAHVEATENLCHVKGCDRLISDVEQSLFCAEHLAEAYARGWADWFPAPGFEPPPPRRSPRRRR